MSRRPNFGMDGAIRRPYALSALRSPLYEHIHGPQFHSLAALERLHARLVRDRMLAALD